MVDCGLDPAPYVLGALEPHEARAFARHLERCAACRDEVAALATVLEALPAPAPALPVDQVYELWLQPRDRRPTPSTLFAVDALGRADLAVPGDLHGVSRLLVTVEPDGGSLAPTTRPVIQVPLSYVRRS